MIDALQLLRVLTRTPMLSTPSDWAPPSTIKPAVRCNMAALIWNDGTTAPYDKKQLVNLLLVGIPHKYYAWVQNYIPAATFNAAPKELEVP